MPLKKPKSIPDIPKTRNKTFEKLKKSIPAEKKDQEIEYICKIYFSGKTQKNQQYCFRLETTRQFSVLNYELSLDYKKEKKVIDIVVLGINTKSSYSNEAGVAFSEIFLEELYGEYEVNIIKNDGSINSAMFDFNIFKKRIELIKEFVPEKKNNRKFCSFLVDKESFSFVQGDIKK